MRLLPISVLSALICASLIADDKAASAHTKCSEEEWKTGAVKAEDIEGEYFLYFGIDLGQSITISADHTFESSWVVFPQTGSKKIVEGKFAGTWEMLEHRLVLKAARSCGSNSRFVFASGRFRGIPSLLREDKEGTTHEGIVFFSGFYCKGMGPLPRLLKSEKEEPNQTPQRNAGSRPSSGDPSASETPSLLGPHG